MRREGPSQSHGFPLTLLLVSWRTIRPGTSQAVVGEDQMADRALRDLCASFPGACQRAYDQLATNRAYVGGSRWPSAVRPTTSTTPRGRRRSPAGCCAVGRWRRIPTTATIRCSRATSEAWAARVPPSVTSAAARLKSGVHASAVAAPPDTLPPRTARNPPGPARPGPDRLRVRGWRAGRPAHLPASCPTCGRRRASRR